MLLLPFSEPIDGDSGRESMPLRPFSESKVGESIMAAVEDSLAR